MTFSKLKSPKSQTPLNQLIQVSALNSKCKHSITFYQKSLIINEALNYWQIERYHESTSNKRSFKKKCFSADDSSLNYTNKKKTALDYAF